MRHKVLTVFLLCTIAASASPLLLVTDHPGQCHASRHHAPLPQSDKHQCCTIGHNRALPKEVAVFSHSPAAFLAGSARQLCVNFRPVVNRPDILIAVSDPIRSPLRV